MRPTLLPLMLLAACGSPSGPSGTTVPSGAYVVTASQGATSVSFAFTVVSADDQRVILDWTAGRVRGTLPVRDTADLNIDAYRVQWLGPNTGENYVLRFTSSTCDGRHIDGSFNVTVWTGCQISHP